MASTDMKAAEDEYTAGSTDLRRWGQSGELPSLKFEYQGTCPKYKDGGDYAHALSGVYVHAGYTKASSGWDDGDLARSAKAGIGWWNVTYKYRITRDHNTGYYVPAKGHYVARNPFAPYYRRVGSGARHTNNAHTVSCPLLARGEGC